MSQSSQPIKSKFQLKVLWKSKLNQAQAGQVPPLLLLSPPNRQYQAQVWKKSLFAHIFSKENANSKENVCWLIKLMNALTVFPKCHLENWHQVHILEGAGRNSIQRITSRDEKYIFTNI
jgi:hypothetical protein